MSTTAQLKKGLKIFDDQSSVGSDNLFYVPRQGDSVEISAQRRKRKQSVKSVKSLRAKSSRQHPAPPRLRRPRTSSPVSAPVETGWKENPPGIICDQNNNAVLTNLYRIDPVQDLSRLVDPVEDLSRLVDNFDFFPAICQVFAPEILPPTSGTTEAEASPAD